MKIAVFSIPEISFNKHNLKDPRLDQLHKVCQTKNKTFAQVELVPESAAGDAEAHLVTTDSRADLILKDLELVETRLSRSQDEKEKSLLHKLKLTLEKEELCSSAVLNEEEKAMLSAYGLLSTKPVITINQEQAGDLDNLLQPALVKSGFPSFFTAVGVNEARAWLVKQGTTAWEAAGKVHSDIQRGFIRAEVIAFGDFLAAGSLAGAKQAGKQRLEAKEYLVQDGDIINFRFNK